MNDEDQALVRNWLRHAAGDWGKEGAPDKPGWCLRMQLDRMRFRRPAAFQHLVLTDKQAQRIAAHAGWDDAHKPTERTPEEIAYVEARVTEITAAIAAVQRPTQAPAAGFNARFIAERGRKPGELTREQLATERAKAGIRQPAQHKSSKVPHGSDA